MIVKKNHILFSWKIIILLINAYYIIIVFHRQINIIVYNVYFVKYKIYISFSCISVKKSQN